MAQIFKSIEIIADINNMSERQSKLWQICENVEDWRDGVCSYKEDHPFGADDEEVVNVEDTELFTVELTENSYLYRDVLCIDLKGAYINQNLLEAIHNSCPKLECLFINITEFTEDSWHYLINNIAPQLKHLSLDNSICFKVRNQSYQTVNFEELFTNCKLLEELKLVLFKSFDRNLPVKSIFDYETLRYLNDNLKLIFIKYPEIEGHLTVYEKIDFKEKNEKKYIIDKKFEWDIPDLFKGDSKILDNEPEIIYNDCSEDATSILGKKSGRLFIPDNFETSELGQCLENIWHSKANPQFLRIETREGIHAVIPALPHLSKFVSLRALNLSIKNVVENEDYDKCYRSITDNLKLESLTLEFHEDCDSKYLLELFTRAELRKSLTRLRLLNAALDTKSFKKLKESYYKLKSLQLVNVEFIHKEDQEEKRQKEKKLCLDTIVNITSSMNNLDELIVEYSNEEHEVEHEVGFQKRDNLFKFTGASLIKIIRRCPRLNFVRIIGVEFIGKEERKIQKLFKCAKPKDYKLMDCWTKPENNSNNL